jgi:hypothetical protein
MAFLCLSRDKAAALTAVQTPAVKIFLQFRASRARPLRHDELDAIEQLLGNEWFMDTLVGLSRIFKGAVIKWIEEHSMSGRN